MQDLSPPTTSVGCILAGCVNRLAIVVLILLIVAAWVVPAVFQDEIEASVCPAGSELSSYSRTTNGSTSQGHACYYENGTEARDLGARLIIPTIAITVVGILGIVILIIMAASRSAQRTVATLQSLQGGVVIKSGQSFGFESTTSPKEDDDDDLADRLQQLNEALNAGLITQDEYRAKRQEIMDEF